MSELSREPVIFEEIAAGDFVIGRATLNSEATLNSLTLEMIHQLTQKFREWSQQKNVALIFLQGAGEKAFCAGGDIRKLYTSLREQSPYAEEFFNAEYSLDYSIHVSELPILVYGHGIVMGGGLGLMAGAQCRVVTEGTKMAMPEITIGLYPDVGATYFLNQMPEGCGLFLGLTATRLNAADALFVNLADAFVPHAQKDVLLSVLQKTNWSANAHTNQTLLRDTVKNFAAAYTAQLPVSEVKNHAPALAALAQSSDVIDFSKALSQLSHDEWMQKAFQSFHRGSPTAAHVIREQIKRGQNLSDKREVFNRELAMSIQFGRHHDLVEGIRALLIEKDNKPAWRPSTLDQVSPKLVEAHFAASNQRVKNIFKGE